MANNFNVFKIAFIHNKFWAHNTIEVPENKVSLNEDFHDIKDVLRLPEQYNHFQVYWISKGISGEICLPGEWNYAYIDGKYFHAIKMHSNGFIKGIDEEFFYYNLLYDDGQNEWLTNNFYLKGTLELTGNPLLARDHIHQIPPLIDNVNDYVFLNGIRRSKIDYTTKIQIPNNPYASFTTNNITSTGTGFINRSVFTLKTQQKIEGLIQRFRFNYGQDDYRPNLNKLSIPFLYKFTPTQNGKGVILKHATRIRDQKTAIFDVTYSPDDTGMATTTRQAMQNLLHTNELYFVSTVDEGKTYVYGSKINEHKYCPLIDLSGCTDIVIYDQLTMLPLYDNRSRDTAMPTFNTLKLIEFLCDKWGGSYSEHADQFSRIFQETANIFFAPLIEFFSFETDAYNVMEVMTAEKIDRAIEDMNDPRGAIKDPEGRSVLKSRIFGNQYHRNLIWDNAESNFSSGPGIYIFSGFKRNFDELSESEKTNTLKRLQENFESEEPRPSNRDIFKFDKYPISKTVSLVLLPDEYKLKVDENSTAWETVKRTAQRFISGNSDVRLETTPTGIIATKEFQESYESPVNVEKRINERLEISNLLGDFSRQNDLHGANVYFGLIPDYHNDCYVPAISRIWEKGSNSIEKLSDENLGIIFDRKNKETSKANYEVGGFEFTIQPIKPLILYEIQKQTPTTENRTGKGAGSDFFEDGKRLGWNVNKNASYQHRGTPNWMRQKGAEILSRGFGFMALCSYIPIAGRQRPGWEFPDDYTDYFVIRATWYSLQDENTDIGSKYAPTNAGYMQSGGSKNISNQTNGNIFGKVPAQRVDAPYTNETHTWRDFQIEITLPTKTETFDTIKILRDFNDLPNNFLQWEVINSDVKKGTIPVRVRTLKEQGNTNDPKLDLLTDEEEAKLPEDSIVKIYICNKPQPQGKPGYEVDRDTGEGYANKYSDRSLYPNIPVYTYYEDGNTPPGYQPKYGYVPAYAFGGFNGEIRVQHLIALLCSAFFLTSWERSEPRGAIPYGIEQLKDTAKYPKHSDGRSQLAISWVKPYNGFGFIAGTRFYAPSFQFESMRTLPEENTKRFSMQGTTDGIFCEIPPQLKVVKYLKEYKNIRQKVSQMDANLQMCFMYGGYCFNEKQGEFWADTSYYQAAAIRHENFGPPDAYQQIGKHLNREYSTEKALRLDNSGNSAKKETNESDTFNHRGFTKFLHPRNIIMKMHYFNYGGNDFKGWNGAGSQNREFYESMNDGNSILLNGFLKNQNTFRTIKMKNGEGFSAYNKLVVPGQSDTVFSFSTFDNDIPPMISQYINPKLPNENFNVRFPLTQTDLNRQPSIKTKAERESFFRSKIEKLCKETLDAMTKGNSFIKFEGTNGYASIKLDLSSDKEIKVPEPSVENPDVELPVGPPPPGVQSGLLPSPMARPFWDFEFFTDVKENIKGKESEIWDFENKIQSDVDVLINSKFELNVYGSKFPLKSRPYITNNLLDIGLTVTPLHDIKQSLAAVYYAVSMNHNEQDILETYIEVLKDEVATLNLNIYDRERLIRQIGMLGDEFAFNKQNIAFQRRENKFMSEFEHDGNYKEGKYGVARGAAQIVGGVFDTALSMTSTGALAHGINLASNASQVISGHNVQFAVPGYHLPPGRAQIASSTGASRALDGSGIPEDPFNDTGLATVRGPRGFGPHNPGGSGRGAIAGRTPGQKEIPYHQSFRERLSQGFNGYTGDPANFQRLAQVSNRARQVVHGIGGIIEGGLAIAESYESGNIKDKYIKEKYSLAESKLSAQGNILNKRFEHERTNLLFDLHRASANVVLPQLQAGIVYKLYNQAKNLNNVFMIQYFPSGKIREYIHEYYREYGYPVMVRNFKCSGIKDIVGHIRFQYIYVMNHPNISIGEMIKARALMGVKVVPWSQFRDLDEEIDKYEKAQKLREHHSVHGHQQRPQQSEIREITEEGIEEASEEEVEKHIDEFIS